MKRVDDVGRMKIGTRDTAVDDRIGADVAEFELLGLIVPDRDLDDVRDGVCAVRDVANRTTDRPCQSRS